MSRRYRIVCDSPAHEGRIAVVAEWSPGLYGSVSPIGPGVDQESVSDSDAGPARGEAPRYLCKEVPETGALVRTRYTFECPLCAASRVTGRQRVVLLQARLDDMAHGMAQAGVDQLLLRHLAARV